LDQIAAFEGDKIDEQTVVQALGLVDRELLLDFCRAIAAGDSPGVLGICKKVTDGGTDPDDFVAELLEQFRLLMIVAGAGQAPETSGLTDDELSIYQKLSKSLGVGDILRLIKIAGDLNLDLKTGLDPRLLLEVAAVRMAELERTVALQEVIDRMGTTRPSAPLQKKKPEAAPPAAVTTLRRPPEPTDRANEAPPSWPRREVSLETVRSGWEKFLGELGHRRSMLASQLAMAEVRSAAGRTVVAAFGTSGHAALQVLQKPTNLSLISEALCRHFESDLNLHLTQIEDAQPTARRKRPGRRRVDPTQLLAKSARLRELVEKVDGEIIGVRRAAD